MKQRWKNKRNMYSVVLTTCKKHQAVWSNVPEFVATVSELESKLAEFAQTSEERLQDTSSITKNKDKLIDNLHEKVYSVVRTIEAYALKEGLDELAMEYNITKASLIEGGAKVTINKFNNVVKKATKLASDLEPLGITSQFLQEFTQEVDDARKVILKPRLAIVKRKMLTKKLEELIDEMDEIVYKHLTGMVRIIQFEHPMFFAEFMEARNIIDLRGPRKNDGSNAEVENESPPQDEGEIDDSA